MISVRYLGAPQITNRNENKNKIPDDLIPYFMFA